MAHGAESRVPLTTARPTGAAWRGLVILGLGLVAASQPRCHPGQVIDDRPRCGDGVIQPGEICDGEDLGGRTCDDLWGYHGGTLRCDATCRRLDTDGCLGGPVCGDGFAEGNENCDGPDLRWHTCASIGSGYQGGELRCRSDCIRFDTSRCTSAPDTCGDWVVDPGEVCDGLDLAGESCLSVTGGVMSGELWCNDTCDGFDLTWCTTACGDGVADPGEVCDGSDLRGATCAALPGGWSAGTLACQPTCDGLDTSGCVTTCHDGIRDPGEVCDGTDLGGATCADHGYADGRLVCDGACRQVLLHDCHHAWGTCGDGVLEGWEWCDGDDFGAGSRDCAESGFSGGTIACTADCRYDLTPCLGDLCARAGWYEDGLCDPCELFGGVRDPDCDAWCPVEDGFCASSFYALAGGSTCRFVSGLEDPDCGVCGDGVAGYTEPCDGTDLGGVPADCVAWGFGRGVVTCDASCNHDLRGCGVAGCGNGALDVDEDCDDGGIEPGDGCDPGCRFEAAVEVEPNDTAATAGGPYPFAIVEASIRPAYDVDWFVVTLDATALLVAEVIGAPGQDCAAGDLDSEVWVVAGDGVTALGHDDDVDAAAGNYCSRVEVPALAPGTYLVTVAASRTYAPDVVFDYRLRITSGPP